jgi:alkylation response protein AidB-like acyl-CoA dehydrogenase
MDFSLTKEQEMLKKLAAQFAEEELEPMAQEIDEQHVFPVENFAKMAKQGFTGVNIPEEYGGAGGGQLEKAICVEEFCKKCMSSGATLSIHLMAPETILKHGTKEQKEKYLPQLTKGGVLGAFALTEPSAGTDAAGVRTTAVYDEATDEYILNGTKCFITGGSRADILVIFAMTEPKLGTKGMSAFIVERAFEGFDHGKIENKMGLNGSETAELVLEDCRVPAKNMLGKKNKGFGMAMGALDSARIGVAAQAVGCAEGALELAVQYASERVQFGKPINRLQGIQWYLAEMKTKTEAAKALMLDAVYAAQTKKRYSVEASMAKLFCSQTAREVVNLALQIHGGYGYMHDYPLERMYRDAKLTEIYEGTSEVQKLVISRSLVK